MSKIALFCDENRQAAKSGSKYNNSAGVMTSSGIAGQGKRLRLHRPWRMMEESSAPDYTLFFIFWRSP
ncbi:MAG: hypothetical protein HUJ69_02210 [Lachnospiraceae bacterium]|nr:hypothetical protein [Lachnospiraceae bacterium]